MTTTGGLVAGLSEAARAQAVGHRAKDATEERVEFWAARLLRQFPTRAAVEAEASVVRTELGRQVAREAGGGAKADHLTSELRLIALRRAWKLAAK